MSTVVAKKEDDLSFQKNGRWLNFFKVNERDSIRFKLCER